MLMLRLCSCEHHVQSGGGDAFAGFGFLFLPCTRARGIGRMHIGMGHGGRLQQREKMGGAAFGMWLQWAAAKAGCFFEV